MKEVRKTWLKLQKQGKPEEATLVVRVFAGGLWTSQRVAQAERSKPLDENSVSPPLPEAQTAASQDNITTQNHADKSSPHCRLCGAPVQDLWHIAYDCKPVLETEQFNDSADLIQAAHKHKGKDPSLWLHGCCAGIYDEVPPPPDLEDVSHWPQEEWQPGIYYSDASGGKTYLQPYTSTSRGWRLCPITGM